MKNSHQHSSLINEFLKVSSHMKSMDSQYSYISRRCISSVLRCKHFYFIHQYFNIAKQLSCKGKIWPKALVFSF